VQPELIAQAVGAVWPAVVVDRSPAVLDLRRRRAAARDDDIGLAGDRMVRRSSSHSA
jgi:hypothetical protein